jgi:RimJ/RimL family protein N-acetyltransferase
VVHRVAIATNHLGQGYAKMIMKHIENFAINNTIYSVKADTNFDNIAMIKIFENSGYVYCMKFILEEVLESIRESITQTRLIEIETANCK